MGINEALLMCDTPYEHCDEQRPLLEDQYGHPEVRIQNLPQINLTRPLYQQETLKQEAQYRAHSFTSWQMFQKIVSSCGFGASLRNLVPILKWLPKYSIEKYLINDLIAGMTAAVMHIPQGMAYALLAEAPPIMGLYMAFFPVLIYVILGNSSHVSMGTFAVACLMSSKVVHEHADKPKENGIIYSPVEVLTGLSAMVGILQVIMWILRLGAISTLLSEPMVSGFTTGASFHVAASQVKDLFGIKLPRLPNNFKIITTLMEVSKNLLKTNLLALGISVTTCLLLALNNEILKPWVSKRSRLPIPAELIAVVTGTLLCYLLDLNKLYNIMVVGKIPTGFPVPTVPPFELFGGMILDGFTQTMVTYTITLSMGLIFSAKEKYDIDANQELLAMGASNIFGSFFSCGPICASLSRSYIQYTAGCKTLVTTFTSAMLILLVLLWIGPLFEQLPRCVLASIVVVSLKGLFLQVLDIVKFIKLSKMDALVWIGTFLVTVLVNIDYGLCVGLLASMASLFFRAQTAYVCLLGQVRQTDIYLDIKRYAAAREIPRIKIFHYCGAINFASKMQFRSQLFRKIHHQSETELQCVIFDASALSYIDVPGTRMLVMVQKELAASEVIFLFACVSDPVRESIEKFNLLEHEKLSTIIFPTIHDAVLYYQSVIISKAAVTTDINL